MGNDTLSFGYLEAGKKSSLVVMDHSLSTGHPRTVYVYNYVRGKILEYRRDIIESKLRELEGDERELVQQLKQAYYHARQGFDPRGARIASIPERSEPPPSTQEQLDPEVPDEDYDEHLALDEDDFDEDDEA